MPKGGFGNLIALPLQKGPRSEHHTEILDADLQPYPDQWVYLSSLRKMTQAEAERLILEAQKHGDLIGVRLSVADDGEPDPWTLPPSRRRIEKPIEGPLPATVSIVQSSLVYIEKKGLPPGLMNRILRIAAFQNPEFYKAQAMRLSTFDKPRVTGCGEDLGKHLALPRGCLADVIELFHSLKIKSVVRDERFAGQAIEAVFHGVLREKQQEAVDAIIQHDNGFLCAPTAFGKTAVSAWLIAKRASRANRSWLYSISMYSMRLMPIPILDQARDSVGSYGRLDTLPTCTMEKLWHVSSKPSMNMAFRARLSR
jgi:hypothetical protein